MYLSLWCAGKTEEYNHPHVTGNEQAAGLLTGKEDFKQDTPSQDGENSLQLSKGGPGGK